MPRLIIMRLLLLSCLVAMSSTAAADVFQLTNGGRIEGQLLNADESPRTSYIVQTTAGGKITLPKDLVADHQQLSAAEQRYRELLQRMPDTAEGHWKMAEWCGTAQLDAEREFHLRQVIELDENHEQARRALGYHRSGDEWVNPDAIMEQRGLIRHRGQWRLPQEIELLQEKNQQSDAEVEWRKTLRMWRSWIARGRERAAEGLDNIRKIRDPYAAPALVDLLKDDKEPQSLRLVYLDVLGRLEHSTVSPALIHQALFSPDESLRDRALEWLQKRESEGAVDAFIAALKHKDNVIINRAAVALGRLGDRRATLPLIDALVTRHSYVVSQGSGNLGVTFDSSGGTGLTAGGGPKVIEREVANGAVHNALVSLYPGVNYLHNKEAWRRWYIQQHTPDQIDLRRGD